VNLFASVNETWKADKARDGSGATATVVLRTGSSLTVANVGDSHAVLCRGSEGVSHVSPGRVGMCNSVDALPLTVSVLNDRLCA
jgi:serine/threonine protein phosphatase PrpC